MVCFAPYFNGAHGIHERLFRLVYIDEQGQVRWEGVPRIDILV